MLSAALALFTGIPSLAAQQVPDSVHAAAALEPGRTVERPIGGRTGDGAPVVAEAAARGALAAA